MAKRKRAKVGDGDDDALAAADGKRRRGPLSKAARNRARDDDDEYEEEEEEDESRPKAIAGKESSKQRHNESETRRRLRLRNQFAELKTVTDCQSKDRHSILCWAVKRMRDMSWRLEQLERSAAVTQGADSTMGGYGTNSLRQVGSTALAHSLPNSAALASTDLACVPAAYLSASCSFADVNLALCRMLGRPRDDVVGMSLLTLLSLADGQRLAAQVAALAQQPAGLWTDDLWLQTTLDGVAGSSCVAVGAGAGSQAATYATITITVRASPEAYAAAYGDGRTTVKSEPGLAPLLVLIAPKSSGSASYSAQSDVLVGSAADDHMGLAPVLSMCEESDSAIAALTALASSSGPRAPSPPQTATSAAARPQTQQTQAHAQAVVPTLSPALPNIATTLRPVSADSGPGSTSAAVPASRTGQLTQLNPGQAGQMSQMSQMSQMLNFMPALNGMNLAAFGMQLPFLPALAASAGVATAQQAQAPQTVPFSMADMMAMYMASNPFAAHAQPQAQPQAQARQVFAGQQ